MVGFAGEGDGGSFPAARCRLCSCCSGCSSCWFWLCGAWCCRRAMVSRRLTACCDSCVQVPWNRTATSLSQPLRGQTGKKRSASPGDGGTKRSAGTRRCSRPVLPLTRAFWAA